MMTIRQLKCNESQNSVFGVSTVALADGTTMASLEFARPESVAESAGTTHKFGDLQVIGDKNTVLRNIIQRAFPGSMPPNSAFVGFHVANSGVTVGATKEALKGIMNSPISHNSVPSKALQVARAGLYLKSMIKHQAAKLAAQQPAGVAVTAPDTKSVLEKLGSSMPVVLANPNNAGVAIAALFPTAYQEEVGIYSSLAGCVEIYQLAGLTSSATAEEQSAAVMKPRMIVQVNVPNPTAVNAKDLMTIACSNLIISMRKWNTNLKSVPQANALLSQDVLKMDKLDDYMAACLFKGNGRGSRFVSTYASWLRKVAGLARFSKAIKYMVDGESCATFFESAMGKFVKLPKEFTLKLKNKKILRNMFGVLSALKIRQILLSVMLTLGISAVPISEATSTAYSAILASAKIPDVTTEGTVQQELEVTSKAVKKFAAAFNRCLKRSMGKGVVAVHSVRKANMKSRKALKKGGVPMSRLDNAIVSANNMTLYQSNPELITSAKDAFRQFHGALSVPSTYSLDSAMLISMSPSQLAAYKRASNETGPLNRNIVLQNHAFANSVSKMMEAEYESRITSVVDKNL